MHVRYAFLPFLHAAYAVDRFNSGIHAKRPQYVLQMRDVTHLNVDQHFKIQRIARSNLQVRDVAAAVADDACDGCQRPGRVSHPDIEPGDTWSHVSGVYAPAHIEPVTHFRLRSFKLAAIDGVHHDTLTRHHHPDYP